MEATPDSLHLQFFNQQGKKIDDYSLTKTATVLENGKIRSTAPSEIFLGSNYPNPFNPGTTIRFKTNVNKTLRVLIFNSRGRIVRTLIVPSSQSNNYRVYWDGITDNRQTAPSGIYFYRVENGRNSANGKMLLVK